METFRTLLAKAALGNGISSTAYDTAWVAKLGQLDDELSDLALNWLCERQLPDGSWGASSLSATKIDCSPLWRP